MVRHWIGSFANDSWQEHSSHFYWDLSPQLSFPLLFLFFSLCTMQLNGWPSYAEGNVSIRAEKSSEWSQPRTAPGFKPALHQFSEEMKKKKEMHTLGIPGFWDTTHIFLGHVLINAFLNQPFGLEKYSKRKKNKNKKNSQFLSLGNENLPVALLAAVKISCRVLYCHLNSGTAQTGWALRFVLQEIIQRETLFIDWRTMFYLPNLAQRSCKSAFS